ncbi:MAG TPA: ATP-dependent helicase HrpB, partial [Longimicrobiales bacterium]|nr:ATP-dependent helicase HrpB [Longimicrobiales bacterium]
MRLLPVDSVLPELVTSLRDSRAAVLQAPPGAGKTTRVPLELLSAPWLAGQRILMLEPRRLAARAAARFMAQQLDEKVGDTVGYRVRLDTQVSARTRIEVVTEGVLTRMLQSDPTLEQVGVVIFDEFHERNLHADVGLALTLQTRAILRDDLRVLVMSATLEGERVAGLLGCAPVGTCQGRAYPVETQYLDRPAEGRIEGVVVHALLRALEHHEGDALVFLPGAAEIQRTHELFRAELPKAPARSQAGWLDVYPLYGNLSSEEQDRAIAPAPHGRRKVVLATSIAETSLTIEGVRIVIDSGLQRVPRFSPRTGMSRLETVPVARASADQRRGRAGRTASGLCLRLWTEIEHMALLAHAEPEIMQADLAPLALDLAAAGIGDPNELAWLDAPPAAAYAHARELLAELGALDAGGAITPHGRRMSALPLHPRLAHMLLTGVERGVGPLAADLAALLGERDPLRNHSDPDITLRLQALTYDLERAADGATLRRVRAEARDLRERLGLKAQRSLDTDAAGWLLALAYPDRIAHRRATAPRGRYVMRTGRGATIDPASAVAGSDWIVIAQVDDRGPDARAFLAAQLDLADIESLFGEQFENQTVTELGVNGSVRAREQTRLGELVLKERTVSPGKEQIVEAQLAGIRADGLDRLPWSPASRVLRQRLGFLHQL